MNDEEVRLAIVRAGGVDSDKTASRIKAVSFDRADSARSCAAAPESASMSIARARSGHKEAGGGAVEMKVVRREIFGGEDIEWARLSRLSNGTVPEKIAATSARRRLERRFA